MGRRRQARERRCIVCSIPGSYRTMLLNIFTKEDICKECEGCWRRRELYVYKAIDGRMSLMPFEACRVYEVRQFPNCMNRYKMPVLELRLNQNEMASNILTRRLHVRMQVNEEEDSDSEEEEYEYEDDENSNGSDDDYVCLEEDNVGCTGNNDGDGECDGENEEEEEEEEEDDDDDDGVGGDEEDVEEVDGEGDNNNGENMLAEENRRPIATTANGSAVPSAIGRARPIVNDANDGDDNAEPEVNSNANVEEATASASTAAITCDSNDVIDCSSGNGNGNVNGIAYNNGNIPLRPSPPPLSAPPRVASGDSDDEVIVVGEVRRKPAGQITIDSRKRRPSPTLGLDDFFDLDVTDMIGDKLLESIEHMTYSVGQAVSSVEHDQDSLVQQIEKECSAVVQRQREIRKELAELKINLQRFEYRNKRRRAM